MFFVKRLLSYKVSKSVSDRIFGMLEEYFSFQGAHSQGVEMLQMEE